MPVVELYLAGSVEELDKYVTVPDIKSAKLMCNSAAKLFTEAERCYVVGDQERSYVLFGKYFKTILPLKQRDDYRKNKSELDIILGPQSKQMRGIQMMSELRDNLVGRYNLLKPKVVDIPPASSIMDKTAKTRSPEASQIEAPRFTKSCYDLRQSLQKNEPLLLIDCRPKDDYEQSHLKSENFLLHIPNEKLQPGMTASKVGALLTADRDILLWADRANRAEIVLMDWSTRGPDAVRGSSIWILKDIMLNWDPEIQYKSILILEGGYENYILMYPMDCTNPNVEPPALSSAGNSLLGNNLDDIEYPSLADITMKDLSVIHQPDDKRRRPGIPAIDRSSKLAAMKTYNSRLDLLKEQNEIADKVLASQRECLSEEMELAEIIKAKEIKEPQTLTPEEDPQKEEQEDHKQDKITASMFKIMQLDNSIDDAMLKKQEVEDTAQDIVPEPEDSENRQIAASIQQKEEEIRRIRQARERMAQERDEKLRVAKEQKKYLTDKPRPRPAHVPSMPVVDRSVKPTASVIADFDVHRDFAPVYGQVGRGLTGLKNLGNTCYMNSIIQCLSNTSPLVEYFVTDMYRKHINFANKTQGRVAKEVAAIIRELWTGQCRHIAGKDLRYVVGQYEQTFRGVDQQDSHEFLTILIDLMHSDLQTLTSTVMANPQLKLPPSDRSWLEHTKNRESNIFRLFYGQIKSTVKCRVCLKESATYDCFSNLSLELPAKSNRFSVYSCFDMYFHGEAISEWDCPSCKQKRDAIKKLDISKLPPVLVIHFKRFYADPDSNTYKKKTNFIDFPINQLDIQEYVARSEKRTNAHLNTVYNLYAISNHYGSMDSGHYTAYCRNNLLGDWYKYDDHTVSRLDKGDVVSSGAYILFYTNLPDAPLPIFK